MIWRNPSLEKRRIQSRVTFLTSKRPPVCLYSKTSPIFGLVISLSFLPELPDIQSKGIWGGFGFAIRRCRKSRRSTHIAIPRRAARVHNISLRPYIPGIDGISWQPPARKVGVRSGNWKNAFFVSSKNGLPLEAQGRPTRLSMKFQEIYHCLRKSFLNDFSMKI